MNPYESPPEQQPIPQANPAPIPEPESPLFVNKLFHYLSVAAVIGLGVFLGMLAWAILSVAPPD